MRLPSFTDNVYIGPAASPSEKDVIILVETRPKLPCRRAAAPRLTFSTANGASIDGSPLPCDVVVWNPYASASPGDLPPPAYKSFVCVEPGLVAESHRLLPRATAAIWQKIVPVM